MTKKIILIVFLLLAVAGGTGLYYYYKPVSRLENVTPDFTTDAKNLFSEFEMNEEAATQKYLGKVIELSGNVKNTAVADSEKYNVTIESGDELSGILCEVNAAANPSVKELKAGDNIRIKGVCSGKLMDVVLVNCSIKK